MVTPFYRLVVAALMTSALTVACRQQPSRPAVETTEDNAITPVGVQPAQIGSLRAVIHASGSIVPADGAEFLAIAPEPARIVDVTRNQGEPVSAGDVIVRFELPSATQELARQQAELARVEAQLENVRATRNRVADFVERGLVARNELNQADREVIDAQTSVTAATAAVKRAQDLVTRATVRAPFSGIVANRFHNPGDLAQATTTDPVVRIIDPNRLEVLAIVPGADASRVLPGASARVAGVVDGQPVKLTVTARPSGIPDAEGKLRARLTFAAAPKTLMVDSPVEIDIDAEERTNVVFVDPTALVATGQNAAVFVAVDDVAQRRAVMTGVTTELGVEITSGLNVGELVITRGQTNLKDGDRISAAVTR